MAAQTQEQRVAAAAGPENVKAQKNSTAMNAKVAQAAPRQPDTTARRQKR